MLIRVKNKPRNPNHPLHGGVLTRRQLIGQGLLAGGHAADGRVPEPVRQSARGLRHAVAGYAALKNCPAAS